MILNSFDKSCLHNKLELFNIFWEAFHWPKNQNWIAPTEFTFITIAVDVLIFVAAERRRQLKKLSFSSSGGGYGSSGAHQPFV